MKEPYRFEYDGHTVELYPATVRTAMEESRIRAKLVSAYEYVPGDIPDDEWGNFTEYAAAMSRMKSDAAWRGYSNMSEEQLKTAYELFLDQGEDLWASVRSGVLALRLPKKTPQPTS